MECTDSVGVNAQGFFDPGEKRKVMQTIILAATIRKCFRGAVQNFPIVSDSPLVGYSKMSYQGGQLCHIVRLTFPIIIGYLWPWKNDVCHYKARKPFCNIIAMLRQDSQEVSIFNGFTVHQLELLGTAFEAIDFPRDSHVFEQGALSDFLYILTSGKVIIRYKPYDGPPLTVATICAGGVFGWSAALGRAAYSSGALVVEAGRGYRISKARLSELCEESPETSAVLLKRLASVVSNKVDPAYAEILKILEHSMAQDCRHLQGI